MGWVGWRMCGEHGKLSLRLYTPFVASSALPERFCEVSWSGPRAHSTCSCVYLGSVEYYFRAFICSTGVVENGPLWCFFLLCKESSVIQDSSVQEGFYFSLGNLCIFNSLVSQVISKLCGISEKFSGFGELIVFSPYLFLGIKGEVWWTWPKSSFLYPTFKNYHVMSYFLYCLTNFLPSVHVADFCVQISLHSLYLDFLFFPQ